MITELQKWLQCLETVQFVNKECFFFFFFFFLKKKLLII